MIAVDFGCCHGPSTSRPTFARRERRKNRPLRSPRLCSGQAGRLRFGIGKWIGGQLMRGEHGGPFEARGMKKSGRENANGNVKGMITNRVYLFYGTMGQKWASSRTLAELERREKLENGKVKMKRKNEKRKWKMWECKGRPRFRSVECEE